MNAVHRTLLGAAIAAAATAASAHPGHHGISLFGEMAHLFEHMLELLRPSLDFPGLVTGVLSAVVLLAMTLGFGLRLAYRPRHGRGAGAAIAMKPAD